MKHFGRSEAGVSTIRRALCAACYRCPDIGLVPFSPVGAGFLTAKIDENTKFDATDFHNHVPRFSPEARNATMALVEVVKMAAEQKGATPAQIALAWLLGAETLDRTDSWNNEAQSSSRKSWRHERDAWRERDQTDQRLVARWKALVCPKRR